MPSAVVHCKRDPFDTYIGRPGPWGNPFVMAGEADREGVIDRFREWGQAQPWFLHGARRELRDQRLGCWCAPKPCHGDILAQWAQTDSPSWIFVFGSNLAGRHGKGAARDAARFYDAEPGVGTGLTGEAYAFPTKDADLRSLPFSRLREEADRLFQVARERPDLHFQVTRVGCGLAGWDDAAMAELFAGAPVNLHLSGRWNAILDPQTRVRVIVAGSRDFQDEEYLIRTLDRVVDRFDGAIEIVSGGAPGADSLGEAYAVAHDLPFVRFPALWRTYDKPAGMLRNRQMAWYGTHLVAFPARQSRGTRMMINLAEQEGMGVWVREGR